MILIHIPEVILKKHLLSKVAISARGDAQSADHIAPPNELWGEIVIRWSGGGGGGAGGCGGAEGECERGICPAVMASPGWGDLCSQGTEAGS